VRPDPLTGPVAITQRAVLGDRMRRPTAWCEMPRCISRYEQPAALGDAEVRVGALRAGWRHDQLGRLVCPYCQQRGPRLPTRYLVARQNHVQARGSHEYTGRPRAGRASAVWSMMSAWYQNLAGGQDWLPRSLHLLAALASGLAALANGGNGWNTPPAVTSAPGRSRRHRSRH
jgi:hypothetical protein